MSTEKRILKNGFAAIIQKAIKVCEQVLLIPFFIKYWGAGYYGEWLTLTVVPSFLALSDFGFGSAAANTFLLKYASGDKQGAANTSKTGRLVLSYLVIGAIFLSVVIIFILNSFNVFSNSLISASDAIWSIIFLLSARILNFYQQLFEAHYRAARRANLSINFQSIISAINIIAGFIVLVAGEKAFVYALTMLLTTIVVNPVYIFTGEKILGLYKEYKGKVDKNEIKELVHKGFGYFLAPIWQAIYYQGSTFVVRLVLGPVAVTIFNTVRTLIRSAGQTFGMLVIATYPDFQFEMAAKNLAKAKKIFLGLLGTNILLAIIFSIGLLLFGNTLYELWTHKSLNVPFDVWTLFVMSIIFYACWYTFSFIYEALNKPYAYTTASLICSIISVGLSWILCNYINLEGAVIGNLSFDILMCIYLIPKGAKTLQMNICNLFYGAMTTVKGTVKLIFRMSKTKS